MRIIAIGAIVLGLGVCAVPACPATINVGTHTLLENATGQAVEINVQSDDELITGMNLIAQIADGGLRFDSAMPIDVETDTLWGDPSLVFSSAPDLFDDGRMVSLDLIRLIEGPSDGLLATLYVDTTGVFVGDPPLAWELGLAGTTTVELPDGHTYETGFATRLIDGDGSWRRPTIIPGEIMIILEPTVIVMMLSGLVVGIAWLWTTYGRNRHE